MIWIEKMSKSPYLKGITIFDTEKTRSEREIVNVIKSIHSGSNLPG